jgi:hypothetical protein
VLQLTPGFFLCVPMTGVRHTMASEIVLVAGKIQIVRFCRSGALFYWVPGVFSYSFCTPSSAVHPHEHTSTPAHQHTSTPARQRGKGVGNTGLLSERAAVVYFFKPTFLLKVCSFVARVVLSYICIAPAIKCCTSTTAVCREQSPQPHLHTITTPAMIQHALLLFCFASSC